MIDLHTHVLPGIDDGPASMDRALEVAARAAGAGVRTMAATPHLRADHPAVRPPELAGRVDALNRALAAAGVGVEVVPGGEVDLLWAQEAADEDLRLVSYGQRGTDLLVETPYGELPPNFDDVLFRLAMRGFRLLLAHPERNPTFQRHPDRLAALGERGVLMQVTAAALAGPRGAGGRLARSLVLEERAHVIASDAHGPEAGVRASLAEGVRSVPRAVRRRAEWMTTEAPAAILAGEPLPSAPAARRRRWTRRG